MRQKKIRCYHRCDFEGQFHRWFHWRLRGNTCTVLWKSWCNRHWPTMRVVEEVADKMTGEWDDIPF